MARANPTAAAPCGEAGARKVGIRDRGSAKPCESESKVYGSLTTDPGSRFDLFMAIYAIRFARHAVITALFVVAAILGIATGVIFAYAGDLPQISALDDYAPSTISRVYGSHGEIVGEFATQRREVVPYEAISPKLQQAILAAEDSEFEQHFGLSMPRIVMAATRDILGAIRDKITGRRSRPKGASTITQQLARRLFPEAVGFQIGDVSLERKIKEALVAMQIEKRYTKSEIFTLYCNQMYLGHGAYGVEAASRLYFGKSAKDLTLDEAATDRRHLPDVAQAPTVNMDRAKRRRDYVLERMAEEGYITPPRKPKTPRRGRSCCAASRRRQQLRRAVLRRGGAQGAREPVRREAAVRERPVDADRARRPAAGSGQPRRWTTGCDGSTSAAASASRAATSSPKAHRSMRSRAPALGSPDGCRRHRAGGRQRRRTDRRSSRTPASSG